MVGQVLLVGVDVEQQLDRGGGGAPAPDELPIPERILGHRLDTVIHSLDGLKRRDGSVCLMAHTRMQRALPFPAADKIDTWIQPLERHRGTLEALARRLLVLQLGGPIGTRSELKGYGDAVADAMAEILGLGLAPSWHSQRDRIGEFGAFLSLLTGTLGKIGHGTERGR